MKCDIYNNRTGKRGILGLLKDGVNASYRYYINNFIDGWRQVKTSLCADSGHTIAMHFDNKSYAY